MVDESEDKQEIQQNFTTLCNKIARENPTLIDELKKKRVHKGIADLSPLSL